MPFPSIGDMSQQFLTRRQNVEIRTRLTSLANELSSGRVSDLARNMGGDTVRLTDTDRRLALTDSYARATTETAQRLAAMQLALGHVAATQSALVAQIIPATSGGASGGFISAAVASRAGFDSVVSSLNVTAAGQSLFSGTRTDIAALRPADDIYNDLRIAVAAATTPLDLATLVDAWFDDPAGGFATTAYLGDTGAPMSRRIDSDRSVTIDARADDPALRDMMKATALGALAADETISLSDTDRRRVLQMAGDRMLTGAQGLTDVQGRLGVAEQAAEEAAARHSARQTAFGIVRNDLTQADPFETANALKAVEQQLELHYIMTDRLSRLTLAGYLR